MRGKSLADHRARSVDEVEDAGWATGLLHDAGEEERAQGRQLAGFQDDRAACGQRCPTLAVI
jgi:hypothetical protein